MRLEVHYDTTGKQRYELTEVHSELNPPASLGNGYYRLIRNIYHGNVQVYFYNFQSSLPASSANDHLGMFPALPLPNPEKEFPPMEYYLFQKSLELILVIKKSWGQKFGGIKNYLV